MEIRGKQAVHQQWIHLIERLNTVSKPVSRTSYRVSTKCILELTNFREVYQLEFEEMVSHSLISTAHAYAPAFPPIFPLPSTFLLHNQITML